MINFQADESTFNQRCFLNPPYMAKPVAEAALPQGASVIERQLQKARGPRITLETHIAANDSSLHNTLVDKESASTVPTFMTFEAAQTVSNPSKMKSTQSGNLAQEDAADIFLDVFQSAAESLNPIAHIERPLIDEPFANLIPANTEQNKREANPYNSRTNASVNYETLRPRGLVSSLSKLIFVRTGNLRTMSDTDFKLYVTNLGGTVTTAVSGRTSYLVVGDDPGATKIRDAKAKFVRIISEKEFYNLVVKKSDIPDWVPWVPFTESLQPFTADELADVIAEHNKQHESLDRGGAGEELVALGAILSPSVGDSITSTAKADNSDQLEKKTVGAQGSIAVGEDHETPVPLQLPVSELDWVMKHTPTRISAVVGNNIVINQLRLWLTNWTDVFMNKRSVESILSSEAYTKYSKGMEERFQFKAALVSGSSGIGKTLAVNLIVKESNYSPYYLSVAEQRSKLSLQETLADVFESCGIISFLGGAQRLGKPTNNDSKTGICLIIDECESMDAGGASYLLSVMNKESNRVPIIFICNNAHDQKLKTLRNKCAMFPFERPQKDMIGKFLLSVAEAEGISLQFGHAGLIAERVRSDVRYAINELQFRTAGSKGSSYSAKALSSLHVVTAAPTMFETWNLILDYRVLKQWVANTKQDGCYKSLVTLHMGDSSLSTAGIFQNYRAKTAGLLSYTSVLSDLLSTSETMLARMMTIGDWSCSRDQAVFSAVLPNLILSTLDLTGTGGFGSFRQNTFPGAVLNAVSSAKSAAAKIGEFWIRSARLGTSGRGSILASNMPMFASLVANGWELCGDALLQHMKKGRELAPDEDCFASLLVDTFSGVSMDTWKEFKEVQEIPLSNAKSQTALTNYLQSIMDYDYRSIAPSSRKASRARKVKQ
ncbi:Replication factor C, subunit 1 [Giardia lamblia P15]|uniref:Replication factor C, subunit 1 n=1 Tax=Giardia intestinalis (strain P15) TaxID=658858 RepID=E1F2S1_GIAIA|nr:Replication factor C, subunit 1 [Giardia lamblia P15]